MATLTAICVGGRGAVGSEKGNLHTRRGAVTSRDDSNDPLSKAFFQRLTVSAPTVSALEMA